MAGEGGSAIIGRTEMDTQTPFHVKNVLETSPRRSSTRGSATALHLGLLAGFLLLSIIIWGHVWFTGHPTHSITCQCGDPSEEVWWLAWLPWALLHGHNPFFTTALYSGSGGVNALANTSTMFPALLLSPITLLLGPIAAFNVAGTLAPVASAYCMFLLARKLTGCVPAQVLAGLFWGFSPAAMAWLPFGHLMDVFGFFFPLGLILVYDVLVEHRRPPILDGILFGFLVIAQFFTSTEFLVIAALVAPIGAGIGFIFSRQLFVVNRRAMVQAGVSALATSGIALAYPAWYAVAGPRHIPGPPWVANSIGQSVSAVVNPGPRLHQPVSAVVDYAGYFGRVGPASGFLGWGILAFIVLSYPVWRGRLLAWCVLATGLWAWMLSWGTPPYGGAWRPWDVFNSIPVISDVRPSRFANVVAFAVALMIVVSLDGWWRITKAVPQRLKPRNWTHVSPKRLRTLIRLTVVAAACVALIPIATAYSFPLTEHATLTPGWFTHEALQLPMGTRVLTVPYGAETMAFQAEDSMHFDVAGGYMLVPGAEGLSIWRHPLGGASATLRGLSSDQSRPKSQQALNEVRRSLHRWGIQVVVVYPSRHQPTAVAYMTAVYRHAPIEQGQAAVWYVDPRLNPIKKRH